VLVATLAGNEIVDSKASMVVLVVWMTAVVADASTGNVAVVGTTDVLTKVDGAKVCWI
jgi:hypothetical protein